MRCCIRPANGNTDVRRYDQGVAAGDRTNYIGGSWAAGLLGSSPRGAGLSIRYAGTTLSIVEDEKVEQAQKNISKALYQASRRKDAVFQTLLETRLANITDDINQLGQGRIEFSNTESWRVFYEQLLRSPSTTMYRSVAHIETQNYWQDGAGEKSSPFCRCCIFLSRLSSRSSVLHSVRCESVELI